jgi:alpha-tubulin suppressor-like RCC1 family protein
MSFKDEDKELFMAQHLIALLLALLLVACSSTTRSGPASSNPSSIGMASQIIEDGETENIAQIAAGVAHVCLLDIKGEVLCWPSWEPEAAENFFDAYHINGLEDDVTAMAVGAYHSCALMRRGDVQCWGQNSYGQLGDGTTTDSTVPIHVQGLTKPVLQLTAGYAHTCALISGGEVMCWGQNTYGQLGDGTNLDRSMPVAVFGLEGKISTIKAGWSYTCAIDHNGELTCWGLGPFDPEDGRLQISFDTPTRLDWLGSAFQALATGVYHLCLVTEDGAIECRGSIFSPEDPSSSSTFDLSELTGKVQQIVAGADFNCILTTEGGVKCWGDNYFGQLGDGTYLSNNPVDALGLTEGAEAIGSGEYIGCALISDGEVKCWGDTSFPMTGESRITWK